MRSLVVGVTVALSQTPVIWRLTGARAAKVFQCKCGSWGTLTPEAPVLTFREERVRALVIGSLSGRCGGRSPRKGRGVREGAAPSEEGDQPVKFEGRGPGLTDAKLFIKTISL